MHKSRAVLVVILFAAVLPLRAQTEQRPATDVLTTQIPSPIVKDVYAVKFLCGNFLPKIITSPPTDGVAEYPVKPGNYLTAINIHNPNWAQVTVRKKAVVLYRADATTQPMEAVMGPKQDLINVELGPDYGFEIDCPDIRVKLLNGAISAPTFIKGWVVLEVWGNILTLPKPIDVTAVYTAHGWNRTGTTITYGGFTEDVESILPKRAQ